MKIFIDDSGAFNWSNPGVSLFCGVTIPDRDFPSVIDRFSRWRRSVIGHSRRELKGAELTDRQLSSFASKVLPLTDRDVWLTVLGVDTRRTLESIICRFREQASIMFRRSSELCGEHLHCRGASSCEICVSLAERPTRRCDMSGIMNSLLIEARKASRDSRDCRRTIDILRAKGFGEDAFRRLHSDTMHGFYRFSEGVHRFRDDETNHRVHQRLKYVLLSCPDGAPPKGKSFQTLAEEAYKQIPPTP
jgi:hypothetical protein